MLRSPGNFRLIRKVLEITIKASTNEIFPVKIRPGKAKVIELMEEVEKKLGVPIKDQKLCHGEDRLSDAPQRGLPEKLICSLEPTLAVTVPEYILITVEDLISGATEIVKIDKEKTLTDLMQEIPSCRNLKENEEAMFYVNGKELCPSKDTGTLESVGVSSGSKMELKVTITFIEVHVACMSAFVLSPGFWYRCGPQETFRDLLNKVEAMGSTGKLEGATFLMEERVFDAEKDTGSLQGVYSIIETLLSEF